MIQKIWEGLDSFSDEQSLTLNSHRADFSHISPINKWLLIDILAANVVSSGWCVCELMQAPVLLLFKLGLDDWIDKIQKRIAVSRGGLCGGWAG